MYATCLSCNGPLGRNDLIAAFPVGRRLVFDPARGRLWVICPQCARWNLAPLEERWDAVEECERRFRSTSLRVSLENVALAELTGGVQLVRVGPALRPEIAAWRYGRRLTRYLPPVVDRLVARATERGITAVAGATDALAGRGREDNDVRSRAIAWLRARGEPQRVLHIVHLGDGPRRVVRARHLPYAGLLRPERGASWRLVLAHDGGTTTLAGDPALTAAGKLLAALSPLGASEVQVRYALSKLDDAGNPQSFFSRITALALRTRWGREPDAPRDALLLPQGASMSEQLALQITNRSFWARGGTGSEEHTLLSRLPFVDRLALEMAVNEDSERRAMRGELRALRDAWRDAEEVAAIADGMFTACAHAERKLGAWRGRAVPLLRRVALPAVVGVLCASGAMAMPARLDAQWTTQRSGTTASLRGVSAVSHQVAWASGSAGTVLRTLDGGRTWERRTVPHADSLDFRDVEAFGADTAYVLSAGPGAASRIYRTTDGGTSWTLQLTSPDPRGFLDAIAFWDAGHGLAFGDPVDGDFMLFATSDGGRSWTRIPGEHLPDALPGEAAFAASGTCLVVKGDSTAWFATGGGARARVFRSTDRGQTWSVAVAPMTAGRPSAGIFSLAFADSRRGIAVGGDYSTPDSVWVNAAVTDDGGQHWRPTAGQPGGYRSGVVFVPVFTRAPANGVAVRSVIVAVGTSGADVSLDGGATWAAADAPPFDTQARDPNAFNAQARSARALNGQALNAVAVVPMRILEAGVSTAASVAERPAGWTVGSQGRIVHWELGGVAVSH